ncbi:MAG TPA: hypothetical protein VG755_33925, partial [Nannocystaceae bacterium]|nr:hypothetical protein [Nannocystaceae bacterium]
MASFSLYLDLLRQTGADEVRLVPREPVAVIMAGRRPTVGGSPVSTRMLGAMVDELLSPEQQRELTTRAQTIAHRDGDDHFAIEISKQGNELVVSLRRSVAAPRSAAPTPVRNQGSEPIRLAAEREPTRAAVERVEPMRPPVPRAEPIRLVGEARAQGEPSRTPTRPDLPAVNEPVPTPVAVAVPAPRRPTPIEVVEPRPSGPQRIDELLREMIGKGA